MVSEPEYEVRSDRNADPATPITSGGRPLIGGEAAAAGRSFLVAEYGSEEAVDQLIRRGRPRIGESRTGGSAIVRARISDRDFAVFKKLEDQTGRYQADLVREGVQLLLAQDVLAS